MDENLKNKLSQLTPEQLKLLMGKMGKEKKELPKMARNAEQHYPLTSAQKRMWFLSNLDPDSHLYTNPIALRLKSTTGLDVDLYVKSFILVANRHNIMKTSFHTDNGRLYQHIHNELPLDVERIDLRWMDVQMQNDTIDEILIKDGKTVIPVDAYPLFRHKLILLSDAEYVFIFTSHHIISDAWSSSTLFRQTMAVYDQLVAGAAADNSPLKYQFIDYVNWEQDRFNSADHASALAALKQTIPEDPEPLNLPLDYIRPPVIDYNGSLEKMAIGKELVSRLAILSKQENVNIFHTLLTAFNILLYKYSLNEDIVVGIPLANRQIKEFQQTVGLFLNTLPLKTTIKPEATFSDYLQHVKDVGQILVVNQDFPFEKLIDELKPKRDLSTPPVFQVLFVYQNIPALYDWDGMELAPIKADYSVSKYDLNLWVEEVAGELFLSMTYQTSLFKKSTIKRFLRYYGLILNQVVANPQVKIADIQIEEPNRTSPTIKTSFIDNTYIAAFENRVALHPAKLALKFTDTILSYAELNQRANRFARYIDTINTDHNKLVAILLDRSHLQIISILAINKTGAAYLPIDPATPQERLNFILADAGVKCIITQREYQSAIQAEGIKTILIDQEIEAIDKNNAENLNKQIEAEALVYVMYTSGSTGAPKGVCIEHRQLFNYSTAIWGRMQLNDSCKFATVSSITTDLGNTQIFPPLVHGASIDLVPTHLTTDPVLLANYITDNEIDCLKIVPSLLKSLLYVEQPERLLPKKLLILGGEKVTASLIIKLRELNSNLRIINHYGPTETTIGILTHEIGEVENNNIIPLGTPLDNNAAYICDTDNRKLADGLTGEIVISGHNVGPGYYNNVHLTNRSFITTETGRYYKTGDKGRKLEDGSIEFLGRMDRQLKVRGYRVDPEAIEAIILGDQDIAQAIVIPRTESVLSAFIIAAGNHNIDIAKLKRTLNTHLPDYMIPADITLLAAFPRLGNGKINIQKLKELAINDIHLPEVEMVEPRDEIEYIMTQEWKDVLKAEKLSINDNFFDAGGNSLVAIELLGRINNRFGSKLNLSVLFENSTLGLLAALIRKDKNHTNTGPLVLLKKGWSDTTVFLVHPAGGELFSYYELSQRLNNEATVYGVQSPAHAENDLTINQMAACYVAAIKSKVPHGNYIFAGWSMGGTIAYEMACQLEDDDNIMVPVIILDQRAPVLNETESRPYIQPLDRLTVFADKIAHYVGHELSINKEDLRDLVAIEQSAMFLKEFKKHNMVPGDLTVQQFHGFLEKMVAHHDAVMDYRARNYAGSVVLFKAADSKFVTDLFENDSSYGWRNYMQGLEIVEVDGNHMTMMKAPHTAGLAQQMNERLATLTGSSVIKNLTAIVS
jgi:amino acid adenylation domain-containing protein